jgi:hypothetical protein
MTELQNHVAELQAKLSDAEATAEELRSLAAGLPARLAGGDTTVTVDEIAHAGARAAAAGAVVVAHRSQLAAAAGALLDEQADALAERARSTQAGLITQAEVDAELDKIAAATDKQLAKLRAKMEQSNAQLVDIADAARTFGPVAVQHGIVEHYDAIRGRGLTVSGSTWETLLTIGLISDVASRVHMLDAVAADKGREMAPLVVNAPEYAALSLEDFGITAPDVTKYRRPTVRP